MKAAYCEITRGEGRARVCLYSEREYKAERERRRAYVARRRKINRVRENVGAFIGMIGFFLVMCAGGAEELAVLAITGAVGLGLLVLGAWMGHAFYGQEKEAEWLRREENRR